LNETCKQIGIGKHTLYAWVDDAGVSRDEARVNSSESNARAAAASNAKQANERAAARERVITRLLKTTEVALARELEILVAGGFTREDLQALTNSRMKAIQQFELLEGRVTDRQDFGMESILAGVAVAFQMVLAILPEAMQAIAQETFARGLRDIQEKGIAAMPAIPEHVEEGEFEVVEPQPPAEPESES